MYYLPGNFSSKRSANKLVKKWGILALQLIDVNTELKNISTNLTLRGWHLGYVVCSVLHLEVKISISEATVSTISFA